MPGSRRTLGGAGTGSIPRRTLFMVGDLHWPMDAMQPTFRSTTSLVRPLYTPVWKFGWRCWIALQAETNRKTIPYLAGIQSANTTSFFRSVYRILDSKWNDCFQDFPALQIVDVQRPVFPNAAIQSVNQSILILTSSERQICAKPDV